MGLFGSKKEGGILDVIRCDEKNYLIWKWSPGGVPSRKMNAIRYGSRLRVKESEVAVFVYDQEGGMDFIEGFKDEVLKTANFPVLSSIVGSAFGGASPFQAEVFFINRAGSIKLPFFVNNISLSEQWQQRLSVPASVRGALTFNISDYRAFISKYQMAGYDMDDFSEQIRAMLARYVTSAVANAPFLLGIPVVQINRGIDQISELVLTKIKEPMAEDFAVNIRRIDIEAIMLDTESAGYKAIMNQSSTQADILNKGMAAASEASNRNVLDQQKIGIENLAASLQINREETQRRQRLATEEAHLAAHRVDVQGEVARTAAESLGQLGGGMGTGGDGMNPAGMMAGMMMGGAVGGNMANMMSGMMQGVNQPQPQPQPPVPPAAPLPQYYVSENGTQSGPYTKMQLQEMILNRRVSSSTYVWKQGMANWCAAAEMPELSESFACVPPPPPAL